MIFKKLGLDEFIALIKPGIQRVLFFQEIMADRLTPISVFEALAAHLQGGTILESGVQQAPSGRYSFLAFEPFARLEFKNRQTQEYLDGHTTCTSANPFQRLPEFIQELSCTCQPEFAEKINQAIGFITYDSVRLFEDIPDRHTPDETLPEVLFNFYRITLGFDHEQQKLLISVLVDINDNPQQAYLEAQAKITAIIDKINALSSTTCFQPKPKGTLMETQVDISDADFMHLVERAKEYIKKGDIFQVVLSRSFKKAYTAKPFDIYRALRQVSPAPYMFYFPLEDRIIVGASPERMVSVHQGKISVNPIAGTRRRLDKNEDAQIEKELLSDPKELAEHMMLVDLARNDVGRVSAIGSVEVEALAQVKHYSHVSHLTSVVSGKLAPTFHAFDALSASFPAGTLSGAPKVRAMELIDQLENSRRGLYGGVIGRLDYAGNFDSCIAIRIAVLKDNVATIRTGAGIVHDSDPYSEARETRQKASGLLAAFDFAEGGY